MVISGSHALYLIFNITLCNVNLFLIQGANKVVVVVVVDCFHILDHAPTRFQLKIKEAFHIQREQPSLNHVNLK